MFLHLCESETSKQCDLKLEKKQYLDEWLQLALPQPSYPKPKDSTTSFYQLALEKIIICFYW